MCIHQLATVEAGENAFATKIKILGLKGLRQMTRSSGGPSWIIFAWPLAADQPAGGLPWCERSETCNHRRQTAPALSAAAEVDC
jgi:hypothetical protein